MTMTETSTTSIDQACVNAIRSLSIDAIEKANSGHPGLPLGAAPMAHVLWSKFLRFDPSVPSWADRDRFVLSAGHGSMLVYSLLHLAGYDLSMKDLKAFRQWGSKTPGHPEFGHVPGVEATTGPLGQGTANAVGMAMAERYLAARYNRDGLDVVDHWTYALVGDGDMMEGISAEAASLAGHLGLGKLVYLYDANDVSLDGPNSLTFTEDVEARYRAYGWQVLRVEDGDQDLAGLEKALEEARADTNHPSLIVVKTTIGYGSPNKSGKSDAHGAPLGKAEAKATKEALGIDPKGTFQVADEVREHWSTVADRGRAAHAEWTQRFEEWSKAHPVLAKEWEQAAAGALPDGWEQKLPSFEAGEKIATRAAGSKALNGVAEALPWFFGGDADLSCSTKTAIAGSEDFRGNLAGGRNVRYGVREHAMGAIANGIAYHGGARTYTATFFVFSDYMRPAMRLAAMNHLPVTFVFTHDSIGVGEDGPTHQPVEHLASLRAMPGMVVIRPSDANEVTEAWRFAASQKDRPTTLVLSRQGLPVLDREKLGAAEGLRKGAYTLSEARGAMRAVLIATGSEVEIALAAQELLAEANIPARVVAMPSWELFEEQPDVYRDSVIPSEVGVRVSVEAGSTFGWSRWLGARGVAVGVDRYGASAPAGRIYEELGLTAQRVADAVKNLIGAPPPKLS